MKKLLVFVLALCLLIPSAVLTETTDEPWYEPYEEPITITRAVSRTGSESFPEGDSYSNNMFTRYVKEQLNIDIAIAWEVDAENYNAKVATCLLDGDLPDVLVVDRQIFNQLLENDLIQPLTDVYNKYISPFVKQQYDAYPASLLENCSYGGELYGLPGTSIGYAHNVLWIRTDWLEAVGKDVPQTLDDVIEIVRAFVEDDPDGNGENDTIGLTCPDTLYTPYDSNYGLNTLFSYFGAYPGLWVYDDDGNAVYGSVTKANKDALTFLAKLYEEGLLDKQFAVRTKDDRKQLLATGKCGIYFGSWWPNSGMRAAALNFESCDWIAVSAPVDEEGHLKVVENDVVSSIAVVSKKCEHPEAVVKILNAQNDAIRGNGKGADAYVEYIADGIGWRSMPICINIDYYNAMELILNDLNDALAAGGDPSAMTRTKGFELDLECVIRNRENPKASEGDYEIDRARITGTTAALDKNLKLIPASFYGTTETMSRKWTNLDKLEMSAFLKIVMGEESPDSFDTFVNEWYAQGGQEITDEVRSIVSSR